MWSEQVVTKGVALADVKKVSERVAFTEGNYAVNGWDWNNVRTRARPGANHLNGCNAAYLDGHVKYQSFSYFDNSLVPSDPTL